MRRCITPIMTLMSLLLVSPLQADGDSSAVNTVIATVPVGETPSAIAITPNGNHAYVANLNDDTVLVIDTSTNTVIATVSVGVHPAAIAITPNGNYAYVSNINDDMVSVIDISTNKVTAIVPVGEEPWVIAITPDGSFAYVVNSPNTGNGSVSVIDTSTNRVTATVSVGVHPAAIEITPDGNFAYVVNSPLSGNGSVSVIQLVESPLSDTPSMSLIFQKVEGITCIEHSAKLTWDDVENATQYQIFRNGELIVTLGSNQTTYQDHNLSAGTIYHYILRVYTSSGSIQNYNF